MARDIRQTGLTGCGNDGRIANVLANGPNATVTPGWYADFDNSILGYEGDEDDPAITTGAGVDDRVDGTDSVELIGLEGTGLSEIGRASGREGVCQDVTYSWGAGA